MVDEKKIEQVDDFLAHHGILGMKWGVRRFQKKDGTRTPTGKKREKSADYTESRNLRKKKASEMSNQEIKKLNERLQLERTLNQNRFSPINEGTDAAKIILAAGTTVASIYALSQTPLGKKIANSILNKQMKGQMKMW